MNKASFSFGGDCGERLKMGGRLLKVIMLKRIEN